MAEAPQAPEVRSRRRPARYSPEPLHNETTQDAILLAEQQQQECLRLAAQAEFNFLNGSPLTRQRDKASSSSNATRPDIPNIISNEPLVNMPTLVPMHHYPKHHVPKRGRPKKRCTRRKNHAQANANLATSMGLVPVNNGSTTPAATDPAYNTVSTSQNNSNGLANHTKKHRVANVLLENEMIIDEIRSRPALWKRTHDQHHSNILTAPMWEEIAKMIDSTPENIKRRWKSLKDHYRREMKKSMNDPTAPTSQWPYYKKMRFMKSQMFVSLRRKNDGEEHMEILSSEGEEMENQWTNNVPRKREMETMEDYELSNDLRQLVKFENHMQQLTQQDDQTEMEQNGDETQDQQQTQDDEGEHPHISPIVTMEEPQEMDGHQTQMHQSQLQDQTVLTNNITSMSNSSMSDLVGMPAITTTASSLSDRLSAMQHQQVPMQHQNQVMNEELNEMAARQSNIQHQRGQINNRLSAIHRNAELTSIQERANIEDLHRQAEFSAIQQRAQMEVIRQRGENSDAGENGVGSSNMVSSIVSDVGGGISDDYHFFMSLMPHVRHFTSLQKLKVRSRIQQVIIEEASNCQNYDPLAN